MAKTQPTVPTPTPPAAPGPGQTELDLLQFIYEYVEQNGTQPTETEMMKHMNTTKKVVRGVIELLVQHGLVEERKGERNLKLNGVRFRVEQKS